MTARKVKAHVFNIKLQTKLEGEERTQRYLDIITRLSKSKSYTRLTTTHAITMYPPYKREHRNEVYLYGGISKGISFFDKDEINVVDNNTAKKETVVKDKLLEPIHGTYVFVPSIHRLALIIKPKSIAVIELHKFLHEHLKKYVIDGEIINVDYERETSIIEEIFNAKAVYKLNYNITYSNNDALSEQGALFDKLLKKNHIGNLNVTAKADNHMDGMQVENVDFLGGGLEVAKNNGTINSAQIIKEGESKRIFVTNKNRPKIIETNLLNKEDNGTFSIYRFMKKLYGSIQND